MPRATRPRACHTDVSPQHSTEGQLVLRSRDAWPTSTASVSVDVLARRIRPVPTSVGVPGADHAARVAGVGAEWHFGCHGRDRGCRSNVAIGAQMRRMHTTGARCRMPGRWSPRSRPRLVRCSPPPRLAVGLLPRAKRRRSARQYAATVTPAWAGRRSPANGEGTPTAVRSIGGKLDSGAVTPKPSWVEDAPRVVDPSSADQIPFGPAIP